MMDRDPLQMNVEHVNRKTLSKQVVERILHLLSSGQLKPGDKLPTEAEFITILGVSRTVLREALSALETLGIITRKTREGTYFNLKVGAAPFSDMLNLASDNIQAIIEARIVLELGLVTIATEKITDEQLEELYETIVEIEESKDNNYGQADKRFHRIIALSANNLILDGMIHSLLLYHAKINNHIIVREKEKTVAYHKRIYEALKERDAYKAHTAMYDHLRFVQKKILEGQQEKQGG